jgi:hypothetical protein
MKEKTKICLCDDNPMTTVLSVEVFVGGEGPALRFVLFNLRKIAGFLSTEGRVLADPEWAIRGRQKEPEGYIKESDTM